MPNWCHNKLRVTGNKKNITKFKKDVNNKKEKTALCLNNLVPMPKKYYENGRWYSWATTNWGTKWDVGARLIKDQVNLLKYEFDSAWSPPIEWVRTISGQYPGLSFRLEYDEPGKAFNGFYSCKDGEGNDVFHQQ